MDDTERLLLPVAAGALTLPPGPVLLLGAVPSPALAALPRPDVLAEQAHRGEVERLVRAGFAVSPRREEQAAAALVLIPRSREAALARIARAFRLSRGPVILSGAKADGIEGLLTRLKPLLPPAGLMSKAHGKVAWFDRPATLPPAFAEWEAAGAPAPNAEGFVSASGMFSHAHADPGSRLLAATLAGRATGRVAELGGGYGWLSRQLLDAGPGIAALDFFEADHDAVEAARINLPDPRLRFHWADVTTLPASAGPFDWVVTNPPFHAGRAADPALGQAFLAAAARLLAPSGRLALVANRQLPYEEALARLFVEVAEERSEAGFKIVLAHRPKRETRGGVTKRQRPPLR